MHPLARSLQASLPLAAETHAFSGGVRVSRDGVILLDQAYGLADRARRIPNTPRTRFGLASGTKLLTALTVGTLLDEGAARLDTPFRELTGDLLPQVSPRVTLGHLLTHTSGVYDYYDEERIEDFDAFELPVPPSTLFTLRDYLPFLGGPMKFPPGERFAYSNGGYILLGLAIEALTGVSYQEAVTRRVLTAAGMGDSGYFRFDELPEHVALGYVETPDGWITNEGKLPVIGGADGGAFSSLGDLERLWTALRENRLLTPDLTRRFLSPAVTWKPGHHYGHGVWIRDHEPGGRILYIEGSDAGVSLRSTCYPDGLVTTVVSNTSTGAWPLQRELERVLETHRREISGD